MNSSVAGSNFTRLEAPAVAGGAEGGESGTSEPEEKKAVITVTRSDDQGGKGEPPLPRRPCPGIAPLRGKWLLAKDRESLAKADAHSAGVERLVH